MLLKGLMVNNVHISFTADVSNTFTLASDALAHTAEAVFLVVCNPSVNEL